MYFRFHDRMNHNFKDRGKNDHFGSELWPWSFKPVTDITGWYFFPLILFLLFPDKSIYSTSINWAIGNALMKPITDYKWQEQDYRKKMSACNVSYRLKRSGPYILHVNWVVFWVHWIRRRWKQCQKVLEPDGCPRSIVADVPLWHLDP